METTATSEIDESPGLGLYYRLLVGLVRRPTDFFLQMESGIKIPLFFLGISSLIYSSAGLTLVSGGKATMFLILLLNCWLLPLVSAVISLVSVRCLSVENISFSRVLAIHAFSTGAVLPVSWLPGLIWFTEPAKWVLVWKGLVHSCGLSKIQAALVVGLCLGFLIFAYRICAGLLLSGS